MGSVKSSFLYFPRMEKRTPFSRYLEVLAGTADEETIVEYHDPTSEVYEYVKHDEAMERWFDYLTGVADEKTKAEIRDPASELSERIREEQCRVLSMEEHGPRHLRDHPEVKFMNKLCKLLENRSPSKEKGEYSE